MATVRAAPKRHRHTEQFSGILPDQYLPQEGGREGWEKTKAQNGTQTAIYCHNTLRRTSSKQVHIL